MKLKDMLNKAISYESMEKFMDYLDAFICYAVCLIGGILVIIQLYRLHISLLSM